ncbi:MAG: DUF1801 domain-containing protein [Chloroflexota bacterium]
MSQRPDGFDDLLAPLDPARRAEMEALDASIRTLAPDLAPSVSSGMFGYGHTRYTYATGRSGETASLAVAARASGISVYVCFAEVERWADRLPKANCGKGCIRLKRAADLDPTVLQEIVDYARTTNGKHLDWTGQDQRHGAAPKVTPA